MLWLESQKGVTGLQMQGDDGSYKNYKDILRLNRGELCSSEREDTGS